MLAGNGKAVNKLLEIILCMWLQRCIIREEHSTNENWGYFCLCTEACYVEQPAVFPCVDPDTLAAGLEGMSEKQWEEDAQECRCKHATLFSDATEEWEGLRGRCVKANGAVHVLVEGCCTASFMGKTLSMFKCYLWVKACAIYGQKLVYITYVEVNILVEKLTIHFYPLTHWLGKLAVWKLYGRCPWEAKTIVNTFLPIFQVFVKVYPVIKLNHLTFLRKELAIYWGKIFLGSRLSGHLCSDYSEIPSKHMLKTYVTTCWWGIMIIVITMFMCFITLYLCLRDSMFSTFLLTFKAALVQIWQHL